MLIVYLGMFLISTFGPKKFVHFAEAPHGDQSIPRANPRNIFQGFSHISWHIFIVQYMVNFGLFKALNYQIVTQQVWKENQGGSSNQMSSHL